MSGHQPSRHIQYCRPLCALGVIYWEQLKITPLAFSPFSQRNNIWEKHLPIFSSPSFIPSLSSRLITIVKNFKDFVYPVTTLETKLVFLLEANMLLHVAQAFFKARQIIKNITQTSAQKLDSSKWWGGWDCMSKSLRKCAPPVCLYLTPQLVQNPGKKQDILKKCLITLAPHRRPKSLQRFGAQPRPIEPYSTVLSVLRGKRSLDLTIWQQTLQLLQSQQQALPHLHPWKLLRILQILFLSSLHFCFPQNESVQE